MQDIKKLVVGSWQLTVSSQRHVLRAKRIGRGGEAGENCLQGGSEQAHGGVGSGQEQAPVPGG